MYNTVKVGHTESQETHMNQLNNPEFKFDACPRCAGNLVLESDMYGEAWSCIQCGYMIDIQSEPSRGALLLLEDDPLEGSKSGGKYS